MIAAGVRFFTEFREITSTFRKYLLQLERICTGDQILEIQVISLTYFFFATLKFTKLVEHDLNVSKSAPYLRETRTGGDADAFGPSWSRSQNTKQSRPTARGQF